MSMLLASWVSPFLYYLGFTVEILRDPLLPCCASKQLALGAQDCRNSCTFACCFRPPEVHPTQLLGGTSAVLKNQSQVPYHPTCFLVSMQLLLESLAPSWCDRQALHRGAASRDSEHTLVRRQAKVRLGIAFFAWHWLLLVLLTLVQYMELRFTYIIKIIQGRRAAVS